MTRQSKLSVDRAIAAARKFSGPVSASEAKQIHRLIAGRDRGKPRSKIAVENPEEGPGGKVMTKERFIAGLEALGYNVSTAHKLLGIGRSTIYRMSRGEARVPGVVMRLMDMYERYGIPKEHKS